MKTLKQNEGAPSSLCCLPSIQQQGNNPTDTWHVCTYAQKAGCSVEGVKVAISLESLQSQNDCRILAESAEFCEPCFQRHRDCKIWFKWCSSHTSSNPRRSLCGHPLRGTRSLCTCMYVRRFDPPQFRTYVGTVRSDTWKALARVYNRVHSQELILRATCEMRNWDSVRSAPNLT